jgi:hypothetical protein
MEDSMTRSKLIAAAGVAVLALPGAALAHHGHGQAPQAVDKHEAKANHGHHSDPKAQDKGRKLVFKGTLATVDPAAGTATVQVTGGNHAAKAYEGKTVSFTLAGAKIVVADRDADGTRNEVGDLRSGDKVVVKVRLAKGQQASEPFAARQVVDQTAPGRSKDAPHKKHS